MVFSGCTHRAVSSREHFKSLGHGLDGLLASTLEQRQSSIADNLPPLLVLGAKEDRNTHVLVVI